MFEPPINDAETQKRRNHTYFSAALRVPRWDGQFPSKHKRGLYHGYIDTQFYNTPDLAAAFHLRFSVDEQADWYPTIKYLALRLETMIVREKWGFGRTWAKFVKNAEVHEWNGMSPSLIACGDKPNEVAYQ